MMDLDRLKQEQLKLAKKVITRDSFEKLELIGGVCQSYINGDVVSAIVVCDYKTMGIKEKAFAAVKVKMPYISGFLAYREGQAISEAYAKLGFIQKFANAQVSSFKVLDVSVYS